MTATDLTNLASNNTKAAQRDAAITATHIAMAPDRAAELTACYLRTWGR